MNIDVAWTPDTQTLFLQRVLLCMAAGDDDVVEIASSLVGAPAEVGEAVAALQDAGFAGRPPRRLGESYPHEALITRSGRALIAAWNSKRSPAEIEQAGVAAMLGWLYARRNQNVSSTFDLANDVRGHYYGEPFGEATLTTVGKMLLKSDLITGTGTMQGPVLRPSLTLDGQLVHTQHNGDLLSWHASKGATAGTTYNIHNSSGVAVAHHSPHASQVVTIAQSTADEVRLLAGALDRLRGELEPIDLARAAGISAQLEETVAAPVPDEGRLRNLVAAARDIGVNASGGAAGAGLVALSEHVLHLLGG